MAPNKAMPTNAPKRILGIDPGYARLGFGILERNAKGSLDYVTCGVITTVAGVPTPERLREVGEDLQAILDKHQPDLVCIEELFFGKNVTTGLKVAEVRGVIMLLAARAEIPIVELKPNEIKLAITGQGNADKVQMQKMITLLLRLPQVPQPDDAADALAIGWAGEGKYRLSR